MTFRTPLTVTQNQGDLALSGNGRGINRLLFPLNIVPESLDNCEMGRDLGALAVRLIDKSEEARYRERMAQPDSLGDLAKIGHTLWYVAQPGEAWAALPSFSAAAWKCGVDRLG